ncbi:hypothetical protein [Rossellomorea marisflavi]|uniref:hypothetical protein n=1 Tax=Rossellomorea marisflavi TaxID=189381 RepID=UPI00203ADD9F|nr:hypothetical protein [Rossellomorea marisflavi]MCM2588049.1 hypothetical protein [Rossellomorea marisflavi]
MKTKIVLTLLIVSVGVNLYIGGKWLLFDRPYEPTSEEAIILGEMVQKTVESEEYKDIAKAEKVIAIERGIDKNKGGRFPYNMMTSVRTDKETHLFSCSDDKCTKMELIGTSYSIYQDEEPRLPLKN